MPMGVVLQTAHLRKLSIDCNEAVIVQNMTGSAPLALLQARESGVYKPPPSAGDLLPPPPSASISNHRTICFFLNSLCTFAFLCLFILI